MVWHLLRLLRHGSKKKLMTKDNIAFDCNTFLMHEYMTHIELGNRRVCIITSSWCTLWNTEQFYKFCWGKRKKLTKSSGKRVELLFACPLNSIGVMGTSSDGCSVLVKLGVSENATELMMEVGEAELAAKILQRLNHIVVGGRKF